MKKVPAVKRTSLNKPAPAPKFAPKAKNSKRMKDKGPDAAFQKKAKSAGLYD